MSGVQPQVDHLVYAVPALDAGIEHVAALLGVRAAPGGRHPGRGTRNALLALGPTSYLEIIAPDPEQRDVAQPLWFDVDNQHGPRLVTWAARAENLEDVVARAAQSGVTLGRIIAGSRTRPDGVALRWRYSDPQPLVHAGVMPFFIDWTDSPHPAQSAPAGAELIALRAEHPDAAQVKNQLAACGLDVPITQAREPALVATIHCPCGHVELR
jgi:hypothetical protein